MSYGVQNLIFGTANKFSDPLTPLPLPVWVVIRGVHYLHSTWFWYRRVEVLADSRNTLPLVQGALLQLTVGSNETVKAMSRLLEFALKVIDCIEDLSRIKKNFYELNALLSGESKVRVKEDWTRWKRGSFFTASHPLRFHEFYSSAARKVELIGELFVELIRDMILFSLHACEARQAYEGHNFQLLESVVNVNELLRKQAPVVDELLRSLGVSWKTSDYLRFQAPHLELFGELIEQGLRRAGEQLRLSSRHRLNTSHPGGDASLFGDTKQPYFP